MLAEDVLPVGEVRSYSPVASAIQPARRNA